MDSKAEAPPSSSAVPADDCTDKKLSKKETPPSSPMVNEDRTDKKRSKKDPPSSPMVGEDRTDKSKTNKDSFLSRRKKWIKNKLMRRRQSANATGPERFTYEHMLLRYGDWRSVRAQILAYTFLCLAACFHKAHGDLLIVVATLETITVGRHMQCCCDLNPVLEYSQKLVVMFGINNISSQIVLGCSALFSLTCPLWERQVIFELHFGRRRTLVSACALGVLISIFSCFTVAPWVQMTWSIGFSISTVVISLLSISTLSEMLPYNIRYMAPMTYLFVAGLCNAIAVLHFHTRLVENTIYVGVISAVLYGIGALLAIFYTRESIIHLVIRNKTDIVEETILRKEMRLYETRPEGDEKTHKRIAGMIFQDLVYLDRDEPKIGKFLKKLYSNWAMAEIVLAFFQSIAAGAVEYEFNHFWTEHFADLYYVNGIMITGYVITGLIMFALRKTHRIKALQWLFAACLLATCTRHVVVNMDNRNHCSAGHHHFLLDQYRWFATIFGAITVGLGSSLQTTILLHFLETTPSILRPICVMMVYMPIKFTRELCKMVFGQDGVESTQTILPVYLYHLIIIVITLIRSRTKHRLQFANHLFDLMPQTSSSMSDKDEEKANNTAGMTQPSLTDGAQPEKSEAGPLPSMKSTA